MNGNKWREKAELGDIVRMESSMEEQLENVSQLQKRRGTGQKEGL